MSLSPALVGGLACVVNFGILVFNLGFTRADALAQPNPNVFSPFGQLMVLVWGIAFLLAGQARVSGPIWWAFAIEKACYVSSYILFHSHPNKMYARLDEAMAANSLTDLLTPTFYYIYGPIDFVFLLLFAHQGLKALPPKSDAGLKAR